MLQPEHYDRIASLLARDADNAELREAANEIRLTLNPHPAGQMEHNVPTLHGKPLMGMQHKYRETVLFFPSQGQTCHAYCTFCFRWPQFVGMEGLKFAMRDGELLREYVEEHPEVSDILFTGGDPLIMKTRILRGYIEPLLEPGRAPNISTIRIGSKALAYWPQRLISDDDADELLDLFRRVVASGRQLAMMSHFNHPVEVEAPPALEAIRVLRETGTQIRTQTPLLKHINDDPAALARMWRLQTQTGCIPYYLFVARDTGAKRYFELPLIKCWEIFREAYSSVSGVARTVRGPSMSATPGKVQVLGVSEAAGERVIVLRMLQGRNPDWVGRPFFARYSETASWLRRARAGLRRERVLLRPRAERDARRARQPLVQRRTRAPARRRRLAASRRVAARLARRERLPAGHRPRTRRRPRATPVRRPSSRRRDRAARCARSVRSGSPALR